MSWISSVFQWNYEHGQGEIIFTAYLRTSSCHINSLIQTRQPWPSTLSSVAFHHRRRWMAMDLILGLFIVRLLLSAILCAFVYGTKDSLFMIFPTTYHQCSYPCIPNRPIRNPHRFRSTYRAKSI